MSFIVEVSKIVTYNSIVTPEYPRIYFLMRGNFVAYGDLLVENRQDFP